MDQQFIANYAAAAPDLAGEEAKQQTGFCTTPSGLETLASECYQQVHRFGWWGSKTTDRFLRHTCWHFNVNNKCTEALKRNVQVKVTLLRQKRSRFSRFVTRTDSANFQTSTPSTHSAQSASSAPMHQVQQVHWVPLRTKYNKYIEYINCIKCFKCIYAPSATSAQSAKWQTFAVKWKRLQISDIT